MGAPVNLRRFKMKNYSIILLFIISGCITSGPVDKGPYATAAVQKQAFSGIDNTGKIAVRNIVAKYSMKQSFAWNVWVKGDDRLKAKAPIAGMSIEQLQAWSNEVGKQRIRISERRDNLLASYAKTRMEELQQVADNTSQSKEAILNIVATWKAQGEISQITMDNIMTIFSTGLSAYQDYQHIKSLRKEAEEAASRAEEEASELESVE